MATAAAPDIVTQGPVDSTTPRSPARAARVRHWAPLATLALVLAFGTWIRLVSLGASELWTDEIYHVHAAASLDRGDGPRLPSGELYTRGIDITRLVRVASQYIGDPETAARLPSAVFGIAGLLVFAAIAWRLGGPWSSVWAVLLLAVFPVALQEARNTRFYTLQLLFGLVAFYAGWRAIRPATGDGGASAHDASSLTARWGWVALTLAAFLAGARVQPTTLSVAAGWGLGVLVFAIADLARLGRQAIRRSISTQLVIIGVAGLALVLAAAPSAMRAIIELAMDVPLWAEGKYSPRFYYWLFANTTPLLLSLSPVIFLAAMRRNVALGTYLVTWFTVPLALHSFVFEFQTERYVLLALPGLFMAAAIAAVDGSGALFRLASTEIRRRVPAASPRVARSAAVCMLASVVGFGLFTMPAFSRSTRVARRELEVRSETNWRRALEILRSTPGADTLPWTSYQHLSAAYYWGRMDFAIERGLLDRPAGGPDTPGPREIVVHPEGTPDFYLGVPVLWRASAVREYFGAGRDVIVAFDSTIAPDPPNPGGVLEGIRKVGATELCQGRCGTVLLYRWTLTAEDSTGGR